MIPRLLAARRIARNRAADDAYILAVAARAVADERNRRQSAFDTALDEFARPRLTTETILDGYLAAVNL